MEKNNKKLTIKDIVDEYKYIFDRKDGIVTARKIEPTRDYLFFKDKNEKITLIPELSYMQEGDYNVGPYKSSSSVPYQSSIRGCKSYDVHEWGFESIDDQETIGRYDKHFRYVTLNDSQKLVKVFESDKYIEKPWGDLYHRNKDEEGKQCIRLVDLAGNVHSIKEHGRVAEKGLREKTYGPRGDYQLKVVYKDKEPVYALFMGSYLEETKTEFCTADELKELYEKMMSMQNREGNCFAVMPEIIENFNDSFMKGKFEPRIQKTKKSTSQSKSTQSKINDTVGVPIQEKTVTELALELNRLEEQELKSKELYEQYNKQLKEQNEKNGKEVDD